MTESTIPRHSNRDCDLQKFPELRAVLEQAKLLSYFSSFVEQGGDDVKQLCDASQEEFDEIVNLVGMASKPLHVRRLAKALAACNYTEAAATHPANGSQRSLIARSPPDAVESKVQSLSRETRANSEQLSLATKRYSSGDITEPHFPKKTKKDISFTFPENIPCLLDLTKLDEFRLNLIQESSKIYGRDEKKRRTKLTPNEALINEAAAQLCLRDPTLLVRRDVLFALARKIAKEDGCLAANGSHVLSPVRKGSSGDDTPADLKVPPLIKLPEAEAQEACSDMSSCVDDQETLVCSSSSFQPVIDDVENDYDVIMCYKLHSRWPKGVRKGRKSHLRRKAKRMDLVDGALFYLGLNDKISRAWIVDKEARRKVIEMMHVDSSGKHYGRDKTNSRVASSYFWRGIADDVANYVRSCLSCRSNTDRYRSFLVSTTPNDEHKADDATTALNSFLPDAATSLAERASQLGSNSFSSPRITDFTTEKTSPPVVSVVEDRGTGSQGYDVQFVFSERREQGRDNSGVMATQHR